MFFDYLVLLCRTFFAVEKRKKRRKVLLLTNVRITVITLQVFWLNYYKQTTLNLLPLETPTTVKHIESKCHINNPSLHK